MVKNRNERPRLVAWFVGATIAAYLFQFYAWSLQPGNVANPSIAVSPAWWSVASFPLFWIVPDKIVEPQFGAVLLANSLVWGTALALARRFSRSVTRQAT